MADVPSDRHRLEVEFLSGLIEPRWWGGCSCGWSDYDPSLLRVRRSHADHVRRELAVECELADERGRDPYTGARDVYQ